MNTQFERFRDTMKKVLMLDQADLDFGIYRIMNQKRNDIENYLDKDLRHQVAEAIRDNSAVQTDAVEKELNKLIATLTEAGVNPDNSPKVKELRAQLEAAGGSDDLEDEVYSHLTTFFGRYYDGGDFISQRRYKRDVYAIPYEGEEVKLYWANADQYYIKTGEYFRDYRFSIGDDLSCEFKLKEASTEQNNNLDPNDFERRFALYEECPVETEENTLRINFTYELYPKTTKQKALIDTAYEKVKTQVPVKFAGVLSMRPTEKDKTRTLLKKHLDDYVARNTFDYFIHKDLQGFLSRELDFYIKNEILEIDDIDSRSTDSFLQHLTVIKALKAVGMKLITFLASLENYQKRLWLKKKFVVQADYCITLDRVPHSLYGEICANEEQRKEWVRLFAINEIKGDVVSDAYSEPLTKKFLEENQFLVLDTKFFPLEFKHRLVASIDDLDNQCDGLLVNSENFQALQLLKEKYQHEVKCIYIDPPYNTGGDGFTYKDRYQHSSWLSMMQDRLQIAWNELPDDGIVFISIDDNEQSKLKELCDKIFDAKNFVGSYFWKRTATPPALSKKIRKKLEFVLCYQKSELKGRVFSQGLTDGGDIPLLNTGNPRGTLTFPVGSVSFNIDDGTYCDTNDKKIRLIDDVVVENGVNINAFRAEGNFKWGQETLTKEVGCGTRFIIKTTKFSVRFKRGTDAVKVPSNIIDQDVHVGTNEDASTEIRDLGIKFKFSKPSSLISYLCAMPFWGQDKYLVFDFFAGSGTTGHAVINLNREDEGHRKYILCDMAENFDTAIRPRIEKVVYSRDWKNGKPVSRQGSSHCFKYIRLEQYEDTLNNLTLKPVNIDKTNVDFYGGYMMGYLLDTETRDSLFSLKWFRNPWNMKLFITKQNETKEETVDMVETFNYLIGLHVQAMLYPKEGICTVEGTTRRGDHVLVIWRDCDKIDNEALNDFFRRQAYSTKDKEFDRIYVNGDNNLENLRTDEETWKVVLTEEEFQRKMFEED